MPQRPVARCAWVLPNWGMGYLARGAQQQHCGKQAAGRNCQHVRIGMHAPQYSGFPAHLQLPPPGPVRSPAYTVLWCRERRHFTAQTAYPESE